MVNGKPPFSRRYFFVGVGGSGMMPLALILAGRGAAVEGSDRSLDAGRVPAKFAHLRAAGIALHPQDGSGVTSSDQIVVASAAVEESVPDIARARELDCRRMTRAELNAELFNAASVSIGVAGTSGKSTVTGMIATILDATGRRPTVMNGAVMKNFAKADAPFASALIGGDDVYVSEVDESDGSIALYRPTVAVLNNVSRDHKEMDELRALFGDFVARAGKAVVNVGDAEAAALAERATRVLTVAIEGEADLTARDLRHAPFAATFDLVRAGETRPVRLQVPGAHNVANALVAIGACVAAGIPLDDAAGAIERFEGLSRRFELVGTVGEGAGGVAVIDDFGHNPDKIAATLSTLAGSPGRSLILFQPHGFGPLKQLRAELADAFATGLAPDDLLVLPDPVYHGGTVIREVGSGDLAADIAALGRDARHIADRDDAAAVLVAAARPGDRIVVMGARDDTLALLARRMLAGVATRLEGDTL